MKKYFLHNGNEQQGPFDLNELKTKNITRNTPVWHEGLHGWTTAEQIQEIKVLFTTVTPPPFTGAQNNSQPPPINKQINQPNNKPPVTASKSNAGKIIAIIASIFAFVLIAIFIIKSNKNKSTSAQDYQEQVMSVEEIERSQPTNFLSASGTYRQNFWGDQFKIKCVITNKATVATYKDAVIEITYYSKTKTVLGTKSYTVYETFPPTSTKTVDLKIDNYNNVSSLGWDVVSASPAD